MIQDLHLSVIGAKICWSAPRLLEVGPRKYMLYHMWTGTAEKWNAERVPDVLVVRPMVRMAGAGRRLQELVYCAEVFMLHDLRVNVCVGRLGHCQWHCRMAASPCIVVLGVAESASGA